MTCANNNIGRRDAVNSNTACDSLRRVRSAARMREPLNLRYGFATVQRWVVATCHRPSRRTHTWVIRNT